MYVARLVQLQCSSLTFKECFGNSDEVGDPDFLARLPARPGSKPRSNNVGIFDGLFMTPRGTILLGERSAKPYVGVFTVTVKLEEWILLQPDARRHFLQMR